MTRYEGFEQMQAYARIDGVWLAALWTVSFVCFIGNFVNPLLGLLAFAIGAASLAFATLRLKRFRDDVRQGNLSFWGAFGYSALQYLHAALLFAAMQFIYFRFIDNGFMMTHYQRIVQQPEFISMMNTYGLTAQDISIVMENLNALRPVDIALQFFTTNVMMGLVLSLPAALVIGRNVKRRN